MTDSHKPSAEELRKKVVDAYGSGKAKAEQAVKSVKDKSAKAAKSARSSTGESLDNNPLTALVGGLAIGAIAAALLPKTKRESELMGKAGDKIRSSATAAVNAARDVGKEQLDALGLNGNAARDQVRSVIDKLGQAATSATRAASEAVRKKP
jgi:ElaB/YqjD/DUF883 family membrane-anchored ribosome-binding protein